MDVVMELNFCEALSEHGVILSANQGASTLIDLRPCMSNFKPVITCCKSAYHLASPTASYKLSILYGIVF